MIVTETKSMTGYATKYSSVKNKYSSYAWTDIGNVFDWDKSDTNWKNTYGRKYLGYTSTTDYAISGDGVVGVRSFKSSINPETYDDDWTDAGVEYSNFSAIPDNAELTDINVIIKSALMSPYLIEWFGFCKNSTTLVSGTSFFYDKRTSSSSRTSLTTICYDDSNDYPEIIGKEGLTFTKVNKNFYLFGDASTSSYNIGSWSLSDFKNNYFWINIHPAIFKTATKKSVCISYVAVKLTFKLTKYKLDLTHSVGGSISGGTDIYDAGNTVTLSAVPDNGYIFDCWNDGDTNPVKTVTISSTDANNTYSATFKQSLTNNIYIGSSKPSTIYIGSEQVKEVYVGSTKIYG